MLLFCLLLGPWVGYFPVWTPEARDAYFYTFHVIEGRMSWFWGCFLEMAFMYPCCPSGPGNSPLTVVRGYGSPLGSMVETIPKG